MGAGAGRVCIGAVCVVAGFAVSSTELAPLLALLLAKIASVIEVTMNAAAAIVVAFDSSVAEPRGPKAVCEPIPPNAPARSAALPLWSSTTMIRKIEIAM